MEGKDLIRALLWATAAFFVWQAISGVFWPKPSTPQQQERFVDAPRETDDASTAVDRESESQPRRIASAGDLQVDEAGAPRTVRIGNTAGGEESDFRMEVELTNIGAAVSEAWLSDHLLTADDDSPQYPILSQTPDAEGVPAYSFATERIHLRGFTEPFPLDRVAWKIVTSDVEHVVFETVIRDGDTPLVKLRKTFLLPRQSSDSQRSDLLIELELECLTSEPRSVTVTRRGAVGLRREDPRFDDRAMFVGLSAAGAVTTKAELASGIKTERPAYQATSGHSLAWTAVGNKYFVVFETPLPRPGRSVTEWIAEVRETPITVDSQNHVVNFTTATTQLHLQPGEPVKLSTTCYLGPKTRSAFKKVPDYKARGYDEQVLASFKVGACAVMSFTTLTVFMIWLLNTLHVVVINYGLSIILLVLVVRTILHPITKKGQVNMMRMQQSMSTLQPKMEALKARYANDKQKLNQETMKLYQESGVNPATGMMSSCIPMLLQMPIWIALYTSLNHNIDMRHQPFFLWINDLTAPDALIRFDSPVTIPLLSFLTGPIASFNLLPILVSLAMFGQQKLMQRSAPKPDASKLSEQAAQQQQMQKMMPYMTLVFGLLFYSMPSGLNLYIGTSSFFGMIEQWHIRKHIEDLKKNPPPEAAAKSADPKKPKKPSIFERLKKAAAEAEKVKSAGARKRR